MSFEKFNSRILNKSGKKRILALDGGGIRGLMTVQMLKELESVIQQKTNNPNAKIRDYFDLIGGTSTGAILAGAIAIGKTADELHDIYTDVGKGIFKPSFFRRGFFRAKFATKPINDALNKHFQDKTMEDIAHEGVGLAIVTKRADTCSVWVIDNNPNGKYFNYADGPNKDYQLKQIIRASTAAPMYFDSEEIKISESQMGRFVDGGVSPHNNPAFQLFMLSTIKGYKYEWETGDDNLFILSLGTGSWSKRCKNVNNKFKLNLAAKDAVSSVLSIMDDTTELNQLMMQWLGTPTGAVDDIDRIVGNLKHETLTAKSLFTYMRYDPLLEQKWLTENLKLDYSNKQIQNLRKMDSIKTMDMLIEVGTKYAKQVIKAEHIH